MSTESFLSKSSLNATKKQHNRPIKIQFKSLKIATTHNFKCIIVHRRKFAGSY